VSRVTGIGWLWFGFGLLLAVALGGVAALSITVLRLDQAETNARHAAAVEENVRLALWRMDSALTPLLVLENARLSVRPNGQDPFFDADFDFQFHVALVNPLGPRGPSQALANAMPLEVSRNWIQYRFQAPLQGPNGIQIWPQEETSSGRTWMLGMDRQSLASRLPPAENALPLSPGLEVLEMEQVAGERRAVTEFAQRSQSLALNNSIVNNWNGRYVSTESLPNLLTPIWHDETLLLVRRANTEAGEVLQGAAVQWEILRDWLLESVSDLLPEAELEQQTLPAGISESGLLAAIPARLLPGTLPDHLYPRPTTTWPLLWLAWSGVAAAVVAGGLLLQGVLRLSQRRAAFASAVTHELRTPLTTFQIYTEMLARDMVPDPVARREYLETLHGESLRLSHLVENVLTYARLERGRFSARRECLTLNEVLQRALPRLMRRAAEVEMQLVVEPGEAWESQVELDPSVMEQVLWNLVDNAGKYGRSDDDHRCHLSARRGRRRVELRVRDFGPGLKSRRFLFHPFTKTSHDAAHSAPGVGLGLALSRRLARQQGATLACDHATQPGACFVLSMVWKDEGGRMKDEG
jgi:signal transduction histidine kinase